MTLPAATCSHEGTTSDSECASSVLVNDCSPNQHGHSQQNISSSDDVTRKNEQYMYVCDTTSDLSNNNHKVNVSNSCSPEDNTSVNYVKTGDFLTLPIRRELN